MEKKNYIKFKFCEELINDYQFKKIDKKIVVSDSLSLENIKNKIKIFLKDCLLADVIIFIIAIDWAIRKLNNYIMEIEYILIIIIIS